MGLVVVVEAVVAILVDGVADGVGVAADALLALTPVLDGVDALRGELVAHVGHDEADQRTRALLLLHIGQVGLANVVERVPVAPDGDEIDTVGEPAEGVLERCARTYPVAKPAEGHGVVGLLVCPQLLVVLLGAVGIGQVGRVFDLGVGVAGGDEYRNAYGHQQYFEQIFHCL